MGKPSEWRPEVGKPYHWKSFRVGVCVCLCRVLADSHVKPHFSEAIPYELTYMAVTL